MSKHSFIGGRNLLVLEIIKVIARFVLTLFFDIRITGTENVPEKSPFILLPKHQRWEDIPLLGLSIKRPLYYIAKYELFGNIFSSWFITSLGGLPLNRESPFKSRESFKFMMEVLKDGEGVVVFPEGTYYKGSMGKGRVGLIRMIIARFSVLFVPVGIKYSREKWRTNVNITIGKPIFGDSTMSLNEFMRRIMHDIASLSGFK
jgi:1-acyl-sn-glycerol-3-phosphate acyltransferase